MHPHHVRGLRLRHPRDHGPHPSLARPGPVDELFERLDPIAARVHDERQDEIPLVGEVIVDHPMGHAGELGDPSRREPLHPLPGEDPARGVEDALARLRRFRRS